MRTVAPLVITAMLIGCGGGGGGASDPEPPPPTNDLTGIPEIQGTGSSSPLNGRSVTISGVVTGDFQETDSDTRRNLQGFFLQDAADGNPGSSDGVFVFDGTTPGVDVKVGDVVEVSGTVNEYFGETQVQADSVRITGTGSVQPVPLTLPTATSVLNGDGRSIADLERYEGMLVRFEQTLTVTDLWNLGRFGEVLLSEGGRLFQFTDDNPPDVAGYSEHEDLVGRRSIILDDGLRDQNPASLHYLEAGSAPGYSIRLGDTLDGLTGVLRYSRGSGEYGEEGWRLEPTDEPSFDQVNPRPGAPIPGGSLLVGAFNVLNFFTTLDTGADACGPGGGAGCRGADSSTEFSRQRDKAVTALLMSNVDIFGLVELENNSDASLIALVDAMNARSGDGTFAYIDTGIIHTDAIKAGLIYRTSVVTPVGNFALLDRGVDSRFNDSRNRPSLAQTFAQNSNGARLTVIVNHLKSKGSSCDVDGDPDLGDGQGNCNLTRVNAAAALADWIESDPTGSGDPDFLIIGDMNAYFMEDPIEQFRADGLVDLLGGQTNPYSFVFRGQSGAYDYAFASRDLGPQVTGAVQWHINVDEPPVLDYNLEFGRDPSLFDADSPYRAADHDPVIVGLELIN